MKSTERFSNRVDDYRRYRPGYPVAVTDLIRETLENKSGASIADIGSGTGIFTKLLLQAGSDVTAVEPNEPMRLAAEEDLREFERFHSHAAPAESTGLPGASFDAITVAQAFHWFDPLAARLEFQRLLRPQGWVFILWNDRQADASGFARDYEALLRTLGESYYSVAHQDQETRTQKLRQFAPIGFLRLAEFSNPHRMDWPALRGRFLPSSYVPAQGDPRQWEYIDRLEKIFRQRSFEEYVTFDQITRVYYGQLPAA